MKKFKILGNERKGVYEDRLDSYNEQYCWQYNIRLKNYKEDLEFYGLNEDIVKNLKVSDFTFKNISNSKEQKQLILFIKRHEWLGTISQYTTHWFACYYKNILSGVILFNIPNAFSKLLGEDTKELERLISRGACISWSPKNLASSFLMWCIKWMVNNTSYRMFVAYSDPTANELGTIYQACNFYYIGQKSGTSERYINPYNEKIVSSRFFRSTTAYKLYAKELKICWQKNWDKNQIMLWENVPDDIELKLREMSKIKQKNSTLIKMPLKHKYLYILGKTKSETRKLRKLFEEKNKIYPYPTERGN